MIWLLLRLDYKSRIVYFLNMKQTDTSNILQFQRKELLGYLVLEDTLEEKPVYIEHLILDAVVSAVVVMRGKSLEVQEIIIDENMVDIEHEDGSREYRLAENIDIDLIMVFYDEIERIAINKAKNTPEDEWDYRME